jgi:phosphatidylglycerol---prolipoprotein diacylglyceryl transferase
MYAVALTLSGATAAATTGVPFFQLGSLGPIESFGVIVAAGVLIGAAILRRYAEWHGVDDAHIRGLTGWITITGFLGAHLFHVIAYQWDELLKNPIILVKVWAGIASYGGFIGGALGFALYVWWKRLPVRLMADISIIGLLPAFSIGRIGCTAVSDHVGAAVKNPDAWYAFLAMDYPRKAANQANIAPLFQGKPQEVDHVLAWNLGFVEFLYLIPVNAVILWLAFRPSKRMPAGFIAVLTGILYAPVRFFMDSLRPEVTDPRHAGLTFAQWASILAFVVSVYVAAKILKNGKPAATVARTSREAQEQLRVILKEDVEAEKKGKGKTEAQKREEAKAKEEKKAEEAAEEALADEAEKAGETEEKTEKPAEPEDKADEPEEKAAAGETEEKDEDDAKEAASAAPASKPQAQAKKPGGGKGKAKGKGKKK